MTEEDKKFMDGVAKSAEALAKLLRNPHPGLVSWSMDTRRHAEVIVNWWNGEKPTPEPREEI